MIGAIFYYQNTALNDRKVLSPFKLTSHRICSRRENKHQWNGAVGVIVALAQVKWRGFNKYLSKFVSHKLADCWFDLRKMKNVQSLFR